MIVFDKVRKLYEDSVVLNDLSFEIENGTFTVLIGPSGCGKTTTLKTINRLIEPDQGKIYIDSKDTAELNRVELRRSIGYVIQQIGLFPNMTVAQNISVVPKLLKYPKARCEEIVRDLLQMVDMPYEEYAHKYPNQMSGGQQQRIGVLRALAASPPIVLMDEPFGALDPMTRRNLQQEVKKLQQKLHKTVVFVTHDMDEALDLADTIIFMDQGQIVQSGSPEELLTHPANDLVRSFMGKRIDTTPDISLTAADFMKNKVYTVNKHRTIEDCVQQMARYHVDTLIATGSDKLYAGIISITAIKKSKLPHDSSIQPLLEYDVPVADINEDAKLCFDKLLSSDSRYLVVLDQKHVVGIITKTSMAEALAGAIWGDQS